MFIPSSFQHKKHCTCQTEKNEVPLHASRQACAEETGWYPPSSFYLLLFALSSSSSCLFSSSNRLIFGGKLHSSTPHQSTELLSVQRLCIAKNAHFDFSHISALGSNSGEKGVLEKKWGRISGWKASRIGLKPQYNAFRATFLQYPSAGL